MKTTSESLAAQLAKSVAIQKSVDAKLLDLPKRLGFSSGAALFDAIKAAEARQAGKPTTNAAPAAKPGKKERKARVVVTDAIRDKVIAMAKDGKTLDEIVAAVGISVSTAHSIKEKANLVQRRGKQKNPKK